MTLILLIILSLLPAGESMAESFWRNLYSFRKSRFFFFKSVTYLTKTQIEYLHVKYFFQKVFFPQVSAVHFLSYETDQCLKMNRNFIRKTPSLSHAPVKCKLSGIARKTYSKRSIRDQPTERKHGTTLIPVIPNLRNQVVILNLNKKKHTNKVLFKTESINSHSVHTSEHLKLFSSSN